jgi:hypothetical protein
MRKLSLGVGESFVFARAAARRKQARLDREASDLQG